MNKMTVSVGVELEMRELGCGHFVALPESRWEHLEKCRRHFLNLERHVGSQHPTVGKS